MTIVCDIYSDMIETLQETMRGFETESHIVVLKDDGFLPDHVLSPYEYFVYGAPHEVPKKRELYYDFIEVPAFWEIRAAGSQGAVYDMNCKKADIFFAQPREKRNVQRVEWCMEDGRVYKRDLYNKYGLKYASEFLDLAGTVESKVFYTTGNHEVIVEQSLSGTVALSLGGETKAFFTSYDGFIAYYLKEMGLEEPYILCLQEREGMQRLNTGSGGACIWKSVLFSEQELLNQYADMGGTGGYRFCAVF